VGAVWKSFDNILAATSTNFEDEYVKEDIDFDTFLPGICVDFSLAGFFNSCLPGYLLRTADPLSPSYDRP